MISFGAEWRGRSGLARRGVIGTALTRLTGRNETLGQLIFIKLKKMHVNTRSQSFA